VRIAFQTVYRNSLADIERTSDDLARLQRQVSSGRRIEVPSDDPAAAAAAVGEHAEIGVIDQYRQASDSANSRLTVIDTVLSDMVERLTQAQAVTAGALGTTPTQAQRDAIARELEGIRDALFSDFNATFHGTYLFSGTSLTTAPFEKLADGSVDAYQGASTTMSVDVDRNTSVQLSYDGDSVASAGAGQNVFDVLQALIADVQSGNQANTQAGLDALKAAFGSAVTAQTQVGAQETAITVTQSRLTAMRLASAARLATAENVNLSEAITGLTQADTAHAAALKVAANISQVSLLDYLK
jgi:flagellar hook-associated protein 3 FlgL